MIFLRNSFLNVIARLLRPFYRPIRNHKNLLFIESEVKKRFGEISRLHLRGSLVLDLGANRGDFSKWAISQNALVIAFEPDKDAFISLVKRLNKYENFFPLNAAVAGATKVDKIFFHHSKKLDPLGFSISSSIMPEKENIDISDFKPVLILDLGVILENLKLKILKIDIEGAEKLIWPKIRASYTNIEYLLMESHSTTSQEILNEIDSFIKQNDLSDKWKLDWL